jgi:hypothetical protein
MRCLAGDSDAPFVFRNVDGNKLQQLGKISTMAAFADDTFSIFRTCKFSSVCPWRIDTLFSFTACYRERTETVAHAPANRIKASTPLARVIIVYPRTNVFPTQPSDKINGGENSRKNNHRLPICYSYDKISTRLVGPPEVGTNDLQSTHENCTATKGASHSFTSTIPSYVLVQRIT